MDVQVVDHPLVRARLTRLRDQTTDSAAFRTLVEDLVTLLALEATHSLTVESVPISTPLAPMSGERLAGPPPLVVPVLRAGLGMLAPLTRLLPEAEVGFVGMARDEASLLPTTYAERLPADITGRTCVVLDPMLATGGTLAAALDLLVARGASAIVAMCLLAAPEGIQRLAGHEGRLVVGAIDERLDERGYIVPGLGDAGDRLFGTAS